MTNHVTSNDGISNQGISNHGLTNALMLNNYVSNVHFFEHYNVDVKFMSARQGRLIKI